MAKEDLSGGQLYWSVLKTHPLLWFLEGNKPLFLVLQTHTVCWVPCAMHTIIPAREHLCCCFLHFNFLSVLSIYCRTRLPCNKSTSKLLQFLEGCMMTKSWQYKLFETMSFLQRIYTGPCTRGDHQDIPASLVIAYHVVPVGANSTAVWERNEF